MTDESQITPQRVMKTLGIAALVVLALVVVVWFRRPAAPSAPSGPISSWKVGDKWRISQGVRDGKPVFTRFNIALQPFIGRPEFANQVGIAVLLNKPTPDGLPAGPEFKELELIEDEIERRFLGGNESVFAGTITTNGMREFILYTSNPQAALVKAEKLTRDVRHHQIHYVIQGDPTWENYRQFSGGGT
jgi:hypothetical protein